MIRTAKKEDIDSILELCEEHANYEKAIISPGNKALQLSEDLFSSTPKLYCLVAEEKGIIVGYATYTIQYSTWDVAEYIYMDCLYLKEANRGKNLGEQLMHEIAKQGKKHKCTMMQWHTPDFNERAIKFYQRIGASFKSKKRFFLPI